MKKPDYEKRLKRLVNTGRCASNSAFEHVKKLQGFSSKMDDKALKQQSKIFKALSDTSRLKILKLLSKRKMCVCEVMVALDMTQPVASHHLGILENAGLVEYERAGKWIFYNISNQKIINLVLKVESIV